MATTARTIFRVCVSCDTAQPTTKWRDDGERMGMLCIECYLTPAPVESAPVEVVITDALRFKGVAEPVRVVRAPRTWTF